MKTKNLNDFLKKSRKKVKIVEDTKARNSICSTIKRCMDEEVEQQSIDFYGGSEIESSSFMSSEIDIGRGDVVGEEHKEVPIEDTYLSSRLNKVKQFTSLDISIDRNKLETYLLLPKPLLRLSRIFKALLTVQKYNTVRNLTSIFVKVKGSIERTLRTRVEEEDIRKIQGLYPEKIELRSLTVEDKGIEVETFTFKISCTGEEIDKKLLEVSKEEDKRHVLTGALPSSEVSSTPTSSEVSSTPTSSEVPTSPNTTVPTPPTTTVPTLPTTTVPTLPTPLNKTNSILERIKLREQKRKEEFMKNMEKRNKDRDLLKRIISLFKKESKQAISVKEVVKVLEIYDGSRQVKGLVEESSNGLEIKKISGEEYLIYKK